MEAPIPTHHSQIDEGLAGALIGGLWGPAPEPLAASSELLEFYVSQITILRGDEPAVRTNQHVIELVKFVRDKCSESFNAVEAELKVKQPEWLGPSSRAPAAAVNLALRLAFMIKPKPISDKKQAIITAVRKLFPESTAPDCGERFEYHFDQQSLQKVGFNIIRTSYLSEHLSLDQE